jgi:curved DNA-binding protein CbpA
MATEYNRESFWSLPADRTYYEIFGVPDRATFDEIKRAYRRLALLYHPDRHALEDKVRAEEIFKRVQAIYSVLSDPVQREEYDRKPAQAMRTAPAVPSNETIRPLHDILRDISRYRGIFSDAGLSDLPEVFQRFVRSSLNRDLDERIIDIARPERSRGLWEKAEDEGTETARMVVTNLRLFLGEWTTKGRYRQHEIWFSEIARVLIHADSFDHRSTVRLHIATPATPRQQSELREVELELPRCTDRLLLLASIWQIPIEAEERPFDVMDWAFETLVMGGLGVLFLLFCAWQFGEGWVGAAAMLLVLLAGGSAAHLINRYLRKTLPDLLRDLGMNSVPHEQLGRMNAALVPVTESSPKARK